MNKNLKWLSLGGFMAAALLFAMDLPAKDSSFASGDPLLYDDLIKTCMESVKKDCQSWAKEGGGSEAPRGLRSDSKAELALGERYILTGTVLVIEGLPHLRISFAHHPWLASRARVGDPFYRIRDSLNNWKRYRGHEVTVVGTARYTAWADDRDRTIVEVYLEPVSDAIIDALQEPGRRY